MTDKYKLFMLFATLDVEFKFVDIATDYRLLVLHFEIVLIFQNHMQDIACNLNAYQSTTTEYSITGIISTEFHKDTLFPFA